ncbi:unnamed protein product [Paramecium sonneborni]|uniref:Uncharacterized protein n=1 Tax=Paramecium sonneborni TaxID=65129 RepID=A0A8S1LPC2_9CILI|nr:unnamed protein product [Paramecium sonneborni]
MVCIKKIKEILISWNINPEKFYCSVKKKNRIYQENLKQDFNQGNEWLFKNEKIEKEPQTDIKKLNV